MLSLDIELRRAARAPRGSRGRPRGRLTGPRARATTVLNAIAGGETPGRAHRVDGEVLFDAARRIDLPVHGAASAWFQIRACSHLDVRGTCCTGATPSPRPATLRTRGRVRPARIEALLRGAPRTCRVAKPARRHRRACCLNRRSCVRRALSALDQARRENSSPTCSACGQRCGCRAVCSAITGGSAAVAKAVHGSNETSSQPLRRGAMWPLS